MLKEFGASVAVVAAPELTRLASEATSVPVGSVMVLPPEMLNWLVPVKVKIGVEESV